MTSTFDTAKRLWSMLPTGKDKDRQKEFIEKHTQSHMNPKNTTRFVFFFKEVRNLETGRRFTSIGCGYPDSPGYITANQARSLLGLKPLIEIKQPLSSRSYTVTIKPTAPKPLAIKKPLTVAKQEQVPYKLVGKNLLNKKPVKKPSPKPIKKK